MPKRMAPLAPERTGLTFKNQPVLSWYISDPWPGKIEFTLNEAGAVESVLKMNIDGPDKEGIYQINLADHNVTLKPGGEYEWFLVIVPVPEERSADFLASATIRMAELSNELSARLANTPKDKLHYVYAEEGYWYDSIESLSQLIDARPDDHILKQQRMALLRQVNLPRAAAYDSKKTSTD
ncbi:DUF928 [Desulfonema magnum]|uniref:DUF928 n=2 Tax=Desulfonema magnum TaxID=45655 RepID=A0A975BES7_9BACT|nr:DUF928 [Desulfonema magnum]